MTAEIRPFLKEHRERSIQKNALRLLPWYLELLLHSYFTENERMRATATFFIFFLSNLKKKKKEKETGKNIKPKETRATISMLVYMIWGYAKNKTHLITIMTVQTSNSTFDIQ